MFEINKQKMGAFIAELRKEKGLTQKELAKLLFISDKAVSKWETAASIPDTALLIPLADALGVTVTELLMGQRIEKSRPIDPAQMEQIVKTAISYSDETQLRVYQLKSRWPLIYTASLLAACMGLLLNKFNGSLTERLLTSTLLSMIFGGYFCFFAKVKLPAYYDEHRICAYSDGFFRMNVPGLSFNNRNWPHILNVGRIWAAAVMIAYPVFHYAMMTLLPELWSILELSVMLLLTLGGLFIPIYMVGKKFQ
ncbi:MAG: helix-turn-helix transcriptional regulator [Lachnospiraceae bacterium]|nr:helix-turn-helix transcriptional regulator [Lachnospiraceae bacterium]MDO5550215.1 helix-turn-helix transcriptional regulator [Lachnospiraceae bacterium]